MQGRSYRIGDGPTCPSQVPKIARKAVSPDWRGGQAYNRDIVAESPRAKNRSLVEASARSSTQKHCGASTTCQ